LESKNVEARAEIADLKRKISSQITSNELLKVKSSASLIVCIHSIDYIDASEN